MQVYEVGELNAVVEQAKKAINFCCIIQNKLVSVWATALVTLR